MIVRIRGLELRDGVWKVRLTVPEHLRDIIGRNQIIRSLDTKDEATALQRFHKVKAEVDRLIAEAEAAVKSPEVSAYKLAQDVLETSRGPWKDPLRGAIENDHKDADLIWRDLTYVETAPPGGVDAQSERRPGRCCDLNPRLASPPQ
jgi:hypothetical protein